MKNTRSINCRKLEFSMRDQNQKDLVNIDLQRLLILCATPDLFRTNLLMI